MSFREVLTRQIRTTKSQLCVGIDPHTDELAEDSFFGRMLAQDGIETFLLDFGNALIKAAQEIAPAIKLQSAMFEAATLEAPKLLRQLISNARNQGLITILDAKRGDISSTMRAYGRAAFATLGADALTVSPYLGSDVVSSIAEWFAKGQGAYVVWRSSNPGSDEIQEPVALTVLEQCKVFERKESLGIVLGATKLAHMEAGIKSMIEGLMFLIPGVGAQGARFDDPDLQEFLQRNPDSLIPISRSLSGLGASSPPVNDWSEYSEWVRSRIQSFRNVSFLQR